MAKGDFAITYEETPETLADGTVIHLRKPTYHIQNLYYGDLAPGIMISPRVANQVIGLGLLEAIPESTILGFIDNGDANGDGISGKANYVYDIESGSQKIGRFGWKANQATIAQQIATALHMDLGITSSFFPEELFLPGVDGSAIPNGGNPEIADAAFDRMLTYSRTLAVPARRNYDAQNVLHGKKIFK